MKTAHLEQLPDRSYLMGASVRTGGSSATHTNCSWW